MNFCCHDDYTKAGVFSADHKNIYIAWQAWLGTFETQSDFTTLTDFQSYFDTLVSQGQVNALINPIAILPDHPSIGVDCADFTEQGSIAADDKNIFIAFQAWLGTFEQGEALGTLSDFQSYFDNLVSQGQVNALVNPVKHLPSLESDDQVITDGGLVDKNCGEPQPWDTAGNADQDGLIVITTNLSETLTTNTDAGDTTTGSTIVECEYVPFTSTGADQEYIVPENVTSIFAHVWGAGGSSGRYTNTAGSGGYAEGQFAVTPGEKLIFGVGETTKGTTNDTKRIPGYSIGGSAGYGGNGAYDPPPGSFPATFFPSSDGLSGAGAGGGMSGIFRESITPENALIIAGGGGGAANVTYPGVGGGAGGGKNGDAGSVLPGDKKGGAGATQLSGGDGHFLGSDGETNSWASGGGGGAGWFGGTGGQTTSATWTNESLLESAQGTGGGGSGHLDNVIVSGSFSTGTTGRKGETTIIKSPKPSMINCADDTVVTCTPDFICIEEPGNGSDIPPNLAGMAGTYKLRKPGTDSVLTGNSYPDKWIGYNNTWIRTTTYLGNKKPSSSYGILTRQNDAWGGQYWIYYASVVGYFDMHGHAINPAQYTVPVETRTTHFNIPKIFDSENTETTCITKATSILFGNNPFRVGYNKKIPIIVTPTECPPVECTFEISNITDTEPTGTENTIGTFDLTINLSSLYDYGTSGYVRAMEAEFSGIELAKNNAIVATTFDLYKNDSSKTNEEQEMWTELSNKTQTILSNIGEITESRNKIMFADLLQNQGFRLAAYVNTTITFTISYTQKTTDYFYVSSAEFYDSSTDINQFHGIICTPNTPTPSPTITPSPTVSPTVTASPTVTPSPTICFEDAFCIVESADLYGLHANYELVEEESDENGATYIAVNADIAFDADIHVPIKIKQIGGYSSNVWQIQTDDPTKEPWPIKNLFKPMLNQDLHFLDKNRNHVHCMSQVSYIDFADAGITSHGSTNNLIRTGVREWDAESTTSAFTRYIITQNFELYVAGTSNIGSGHYYNSSYSYSDTNPYYLRGCNPLGIDYTEISERRSVFLPDGYWHEGVVYRSFEHDFDFYQKLPIENVQKVRTSDHNFGLLIQTQTGEVYGTGHFKKSLTENISRIQELDGIDIDELVTVDTVYCENDAVNSDEPILNFAFAYIDKADESKLVYYVPTFTELSWSEFLQTGAFTDIQLNYPYVTGYTKITTSNLTNVKSIIPFKDTGFFCVQTNDDKLWTHGVVKEMQIPSGSGVVSYLGVGGGTRDYNVSFIDYTNAFDDQNQVFTEVQNIPTILYTTTDEHGLRSPVLSYMIQLSDKNVDVSLSEFLPYYLSDTTNLKLIKSGVDYDEVTGHETTKMFRVLYASQNSNWELDTHHMRSQFAVAYNEDKLTFGYLTITDKINFNHNLDSTLLENLFTDANDAYNVSNPTEFYNKIKKITFATYPFSNGEKITRQSDGELVVPVTRTHKHIVSVLFNENQYNKRLAVDALISYHWSFLYLGSSYSSAELELQQEQHNYEISIYNFSQDYFYAEGTGSLVDDISTFGYQLNTSIENNYRYYEADGFNGDHIHDRGDIVKFGLGTEISVVDDCTFEPPTPTPSRTTSYTPTPSITPSPTITCGEPDYTNVENTFVCVNGMTLQFVGFDKLESQGGRPIYETPSGNARIYWGGYQGWILIVCNNPDEPLRDDCYSEWTHSIPNACDFYPWEADWSVTQYDTRIQHLVDDRGGQGDNDTRYFDYWYAGSPVGGESDWYGSVDVKNCTPCDACLIEPNQYSLTELGLPAVNSLSAEWYRDFGGSLCYGLIHYTQNENFQIFKTYIAYIENDASPIGTITITGEFIGSDLITYQSPLNECYIATPTIEGSQNVYRFIKEEATPTPSDTSSPTHTPSPTFTPSPSPTITPSPSPSPSVTHTPSPTETPESELSCCTEGLIANIISKNTEIEFGSPTITATAFTFNAEVCVDVPDGGLPYSVKLKLNNAIVGVLTTTGVMTGTIYVKNTDTEVCYTGTIVNDECSLTILQ